MDRTAELIQYERRLLDLLYSWKFLPITAYSRATARREVAVLLSEAQMIAERQLAETHPARREIERYRFEIVVPTIIAMKGWYSLYFDS